MKPEAAWQATPGYPEGTALIEIRGVYGGWSVRKEPDGTLVNRWAVADRRYAATQDWIDRQATPPAAAPTHGEGESND